VASALVASGHVVRAQRADEDNRLVEATRQFTRDVMQAYGVRGVQIAMARRGTVIWEEGLGYASLAGPTRMTVRSVFSAGSMSKTYTATAAMQLVEQGVLALDEPINTYLRRGADFTIVNPLGAREITIRDLMSHRSGLTSDAGGSELDPPLALGKYLRDEYARPMLVVYSATSLPLWSAKVGEKYQYSNLGVATLGYLVEITNPEHLSLEAYVQRHVLDPLDMRSSQLPAIRDSAHLRPPLDRRFTRGYARLGVVDLPSPQIYLSAYPAGTLVTTAGDHIRLLLAYLNGGTYAGHRILRPETVKQMLTPGLSPSTGLIWQLWNFGKHEFGFGHGGAYMYGWRNEFRAYPGLDVATVVATNQWDMMSPHYGLASTAIQDFVVSWIEHERAGLRHPQPGA
jgi:CubicO group peptidase (beta-lactamase class C family)